MRLLLCACLVQRKKLYDRLALVLTDLGNVESQEHLWMLRQLRYLLKEYPYAYRCFYVKQDSKKQKRVYQRIANLLQAKYPPYKAIISFSINSGTYLGTCCRRLRTEGTKVVSAFFKSSHFPKYVRRHMGSRGNVTMAISRKFLGVASKGRDNAFDDSFFALGATAKDVLDRAPLFLAVLHEAHGTLTLQSSLEATISSEFPLCSIAFTIATLRRCLLSSGSGWKHCSFQDEVKEVDPIFQFLNSQKKAIQEIVSNNQRVYGVEVELDRFDADDVKFGLEKLAGSNGEEGDGEAESSGDSGFDD